MSGFRVGFAVGNKDMIQARNIKHILIAGMFGALQDRQHTHLITMMTF